MGHKGCGARMLLATRGEGAGRGARLTLHEVSDASICESAASLQLQEGLGLELGWASG